MFLVFCSQKQTKNAVTMLHEMFPPPKAPQYRVTSQTGPEDNPTFTMVCNIKGQRFSGDIRGHSISTYARGGREGVSKFRTKAYKGVGYSL